jgi:tetratricopeptide (TPR) repeat protein
MQHLRSVRRGILLALSLLSACAASDPGASGSSRSGTFVPTGVFGDYLAGRFATAEADPNTAATDFLRALAAKPNDQELLLEAFIASVNAGRPEAVRLARQLPDSQVAQLLLAGEDARSGNWDAAEQKFLALPHQGLTQFLQPLLVAWAQQGSGRTDAALATLRPSIEGQRFRGIFALHGAMIADLAGRQEEAVRLFGIVQSEMPDLNLRLAQIIASWQARTGRMGEAQQTLRKMATNAPEAAIAVPRLLAAAPNRPVARAVDGIAEAYVALAAALRVQESGDFAMIMVRLALDLRPDFTAARLLAADILSSQRQPEAALQMLAKIPDSDPIGGLVRLRRVALSGKLGRSEEAMRELTRLTQDFPESPVPLIQIGDILRGKQRFAEAIAAYDRAVALVPNPAQADWIVFYDRGVAHERSRQWAQAEADFHRALQLAPDQPFVLNYLGYAWADMGRNLDRAREMIQKAAERRPNDGAITDSLGWVQYRQGAVSEAVKTLERAVELEPEDATINGHLGDAYWAAGRKIEARYQWQRALTLNPEPDDAAKLEAKLSTGHAGSQVSGQ